MSKQVKMGAKIFDPKMIFYDFVKITGGLPAIIGYRTKKIYFNGATKKDLKGSYLVSSNHVSFSDPMILLTAFPSRRLTFLVAKEVYKNWVIKVLFKSFSCVKIDRENPSADSFNKVKRNLKWGHPVVVFPEAHVYRDEHKLSYHKGIVLMSIMSNVPILPVYIVKREKKSQRQIVLIGKKIDWRLLCAGSMPTLVEIDKLTKLLENESNNLKLEYDKQHI